MMGAKEEKEEDEEGGRGEEWSGEEIETSDSERQKLNMSVSERGECRWNLYFGLRSAFLISDYWDWHVRHLESLAPSSHTGNLTQKKLSFVSAKEKKKKSPSHFSGNQLELVPAPSHVLRGLVGHSLSCIRVPPVPRSFTCRKRLTLHTGSVRQIQQMVNRDGSNGAHSSLQNKTEIHKKKNPQMSK